MKRLHENYSITLNGYKLEIHRMCHEKIVLADFDNDIYKRLHACEAYRIKRPLANIFTGVLLNKNVHRTFMHRYEKY